MSKRQKHGGAAFEGLENRRMFAFPAGIGAAGVDVGRSVDADQAGNVYAVGTFQQTVDVDPGAGVTNLSGGGTYIVKYAPNGTVVWARSIAGTEANKVAVDKAGNVYVAGSFQGEADFNPIKGKFIMTSAGGDDAFLVKLTTRGTLIYAKRFGGAAEDVATGLAVTHDGEVRLGGTFQGRADFDPSSAVFSIGNGGAADGFILSLDTAGAFEWAGSFSGATSVALTDMTLDPSGNVLATGNYVGAVDFNPVKGVAFPGLAGTPQAYTLKWDANGAFVTMRGFGGVGTTIGSSVTSDRDGNIYTLGNFSDTADFDPTGGTFNLTAPLTGQTFVSKLTSAGAFVWAKALGGTPAVSTAQGEISVNKGQNVFLTGQFSGTQDFDPDAGTTNLTTAGLVDVFVARLDPDGSLNTARRVGGNTIDLVLGSALDYSSNLILTGRFTGTANFATTGAAENLTSAGDDDAFIQKLDAALDPA